MKIGFISDIHGNIFALKNCLEFLNENNIDEIYFLGDAIGYLPYGLDVIDLLTSKKINSLQGNHEAMILGELPIKKENEDVYKLDFVKDKISETQIQLISNWEKKSLLEIDGVKIFMVHGSPNENLTGYIYPDTEITNEMMPNNFNFIIMGHTHYPMIRKNNNQILLNPGSIGLPRDIGNLSSLIIMDTKTQEAKIHRIPFELSNFEKDILEKKIHINTINCLNRKK